MFATDFDLANLSRYHSIISHRKIAQFKSRCLTLMVLVGRRFVVDTDSQYLIASLEVAEAA